MKHGILKMALAIGLIASSSVTQAGDNNELVITFPKEDNNEEEGRFVYRYPAPGVKSSGYVSEQAGMNEDVPEEEM